MYMLRRRATMKGQVLYIFDNARSHRRADQAHQRDNITLRKLPAYLALFFNIAQQCFSQWKTVVKCDVSDVQDRHRTCDYIESACHSKCDCHQC